jgi:DNA-binding response OmpR family regulator
MDELVAQTQATRPDTVLLDWELPGLNGNGALYTALSMP